MTWKIESTQNKVENFSRNLFFISTIIKKMFRQIYPSQMIGHRLNVVRTKRAVPRNLYMFFWFALRLLFIILGFIRILQSRWMCFVYFGRHAFRLQEKHCFRFVWAQTECLDFNAFVSSCTRRSWAATEWKHKTNIDRERKKRAHQPQNDENNGAYCGRRPFMAIIGIPISISISMSGVRTASMTTTSRSSSRAQSLFPKW